MYEQEKGYVNNKIWNWIKFEIREYKKKEKKKGRINLTCM